MASPRRSIELRTRCRDDATLVQRIADGDESALATLYDTTCGLIHGLLLRMLGSPAAAEQVLLSVYQEVWGQAAAYGEDREEPLSWLITMAHSRAVARLRADGQGRPRRASLKSGGRALASESQTEEIISEGRQLVQSAVAELSPTQRQIIELAYFSGLRPNEIAAHLSVSLQSVRTGMRAAMRKLSDSLVPHQFHRA